MLHFTHIFYPVHQQRLKVPGYPLTMRSRETVMKWFPRGCDLKMQAIGPSSNINDLWNLPVLL